MNATSTSRTISVPGNARNLDLCNITETSTGITPDDAGSIKPTWNGKKWKSTATKSLLLGETAKVTSTATSGAPVTQTTSAPCALSGKKLTADREGTCTVSFTAEGTPTVSVVTTYPLGESVGTIPGR
ncbi:MAG: hypothetical protein VW082_03350, partial [Candidatus Nanopelagicales bacterium]